MRSELVSIGRYGTDETGLLSATHASNHPAHRRYSRSQLQYHGESDYLLKGKDRLARSYGVLNDYGKREQRVALHCGPLETGKERTGGSVSFSLVACFSCCVVLLSPILLPSGEYVLVAMGR